MGRLGLAGRITISLILIAVISTSLSGIMTLFVTKKQFAGYVEQYNQESARQWSDAVNSYYASQGSLEGVQEIITGTSQSGMRKVMGYRRGANTRGMGEGQSLIIVDMHEKVVADSAGTLLGQIVDERKIDMTAFPLVVDENKRIGTLYLVSPLTSGISSLENTFISNLTRQVIFTIIMVALLALLLGLLLAREITSPLGELSGAIHQLAQGKLEVKVHPHGDRELASLGRDFNLMAGKLLDQERNRRRFMSDIAHELRTPLTLLRGRLEALQSGKLESSEELASSLVDEVIRLTRLVKDLETIGLAESGALQLVKEPVEISELIERLTPLRLAMEEDNIHFQVSIDNRVKQVVADANRLLQILINLLSNAMRHTDAGGEISLLVQEERGGIVFSVQDSGPGIHSDHLPYIFDRFYRVDESRNRESGGKGLGLAIARSYVEAHGGRMWVESAPGQGASFYFSIPN
jgi:signal transduction histidine kinase